MKFKYRIAPAFVNEDGVYYQIEERFWFFFWRNVTIGSFRMEKAKTNLAELNKQ